MTAAKPDKRAARGRLRPVPKLDQEPPHNLEAEEAVLGAALAAGRLLAEVAALVEEADFLPACASGDLASHAAAG
jgi:hypothetical protein